MTGVVLGRWSVETAQNASDPAPLAGPGSSASGSASPSSDTEAIPEARGSQTTDTHAAVDAAASTQPLDMGHRVAVDVGRLKTIEANPSASAADLAELARGHVALAREEIGALARVLRDAPSDADRAAALGRMMRRARDGAVAVDVVEALAGIPRGDVADALDELAQRSEVPEAARLFAERAVRLPAFEPKLSPQLAIALSLSRVEACDVARSLLERAARIGDDRVASRIARFDREDGCGRDRKDDCYPCLRGATTLYEAREAVKTRPFTPGWILPK